MTDENKKETKILDYLFILITLTFPIVVGAAIISYALMRIDINVNVNVLGDGITLEQTDE